MNHRSPILRALWLVASVSIALLFVVFTQRGRLEHLDFVASATETNLVTDASSPTGYADGQRRVLIGENDPEGYAWLAQTQTFLSQKSWRIRKTDTDNAPDGRELIASSPYRWWLALVAKIDHTLHPIPLGQNVEKAVLIGDVWLVAIAMVMVLGVAHRWTLVNAGWLALGLVFLFPAGEFFGAGQPQDRGLFSLLALAAVLPLLSAARRGLLSSRIRFTLGGVAAACAIWVQPSWGVILLGAILVAELITRAWLRFAPSPSSESSESGNAWWCWSLGGSVGSLAASWIDFAPASFAQARLDIVSPVYALLFLTIGAVLSRPKRLLSRAAAVVFAALSIWCGYRAVRGAHGPFLLDPLAHRLSSADQGVFADSLLTWTVHHDPSATLFAVLVPIFLIPLGLIALLDRGAENAMRLAVGRGTLVALGVGVWAFSHLRTYGLLEWLLLPLFFTIVQGSTRAWVKHTARALLGVSCIFGAIAMITHERATPRTSVNRGEVQALIERDLAEWLNLQAADRGAIVLAAPDLSSALSHFGGLRVVASANPANQAGLAAATHILFSSSQDEAQASVQRRQIAFIVLATWDPSFTEAAQRSGLQPEKMLLGLLQNWRPPRWLRPIAYPMPQIAGFENERVTVFEVVDVQENVVALSHLAEYFTETDQLDAASAVAHALETYFTDDLGAAVARIEVAAARGQPMVDSSAWANVNAHLTDGTPDTLPWDRRIALVAILAQSKRLDDAKTQLDASMHDVDETLLRTLSPRALFRFQSLLHVLHVEEPPAMREAALRRMPDEMKRALEQRNSQ